MNRARVLDAWHHQPVLWLGVLIFAASLAGCVWMIVLASRHADAPVETAERSMLKLPLARAPLPQQSSTQQRR